MTKKQYCPYCGQHVSKQCECEREAALLEQELLEDLENRPETLLGWRQQDLIDMYRMER